MADIPMSSGGMPVDFREIYRAGRGVVKWDDPGPAGKIVEVVGYL